MKLIFYICYINKKTQKYQYKMHMIQLILVCIFDTLKMRWNDMTINFFGEKLKAVRKLKGLTQLDLSKKISVSKGTISAYEQGLSYPSIETLVKICDILDTSSDYLLGISDMLPFKMGGLTDKQIGSVLQFVSLIQQANEIVDRNNSII